MEVELINPVRVFAGIGHGHDFIMKSVHLLANVAIGFFGNSKRKPADVPLVSLELGNGALGQPLLSHGNFEAPRW